MGACIFPATLEYVQVTLTKEPDCGSFGLVMHRQKYGSMVVKSVAKEGSMARWNAENPTHEVGVGDRIISLNGVVAHDAMGLWNMSNRLDSKVTLVIARNPTRPFKDTAEYLDTLTLELDSAVGSGECAICLETMSPEDDVVVLPCRHAFHRECAEAWLGTFEDIQLARCPTCRTVPVGQKVCTPTRSTPPRPSIVSRASTACARRFPSRSRSSSRAARALQS